MVELCEGGVEFVADFFALKRARGGVNCYLGHGRRNVDYAFWQFEDGRFLDEVFNFCGDEGDVGSQCFGGEAILDELEKN